MSGKTRRRLALVTALAAGAGVAWAAVAFRRWEQGPDFARDDDFSEPPGTVHHTMAVADGGEIHVIERGEGRPFVLVHGVTNSTLIWNQLLRDLVDAGYRAIAMDVRGHGKSKAGRDGHTIGAMAADVFELITQFHLHDAVVVGHSMGGMIVLKLLADHPELAGRGAVSAVALLDTSASPILGAGIPAVGAAALRVLTPVGARGHFRLTNGRPGLDAPGALATAYSRLVFGSHPSPTHVEMQRAMTSAVPVPILAELLATLVDLDLRTTLETVSQPVLVVVGSRDTLTPLWHSRYLVAHLPKAELHILPGCGHVVILERREELVRLLTDFAQRTSG